MKTAHIIRNLPKSLVLTAAAALFFSAVPALSSERQLQGEEALRQAYMKNTARLETNGFGLPLFLESAEHDDRVHVDVYGIFDYAFSSVVNVLKIPSNWCDIVSLHPNVKACTSREHQGAGSLTFYIGRKVYQPPEDARMVVYQYRSIARHEDYIDILLSADSGPFGTKDHRMRFEAMPVDGGRTFVHVSYTYCDSAALRLAGKVYFATLGSGKVGFTVTGTDSSGRPVYVSGPRGAIERNAVRYYFAIQTFMNALRHPEGNRFNSRISEWYDLTTRFRTQLFELDRNDYLAYKSKERLHQATLQTAVR